MSKLLPLHSSLTSRSQYDSKYKQQITKLIPPKYVLDKRITHFDVQSVSSLQTRFEGIPISADMNLMINTKKDMEKMMMLALTIIQENDSTPDIPATLSPLIDNLSKSYIIFYKTVINFFVQQQQLKITASSNQVISSASCQIPTKNFTKDWKTLIKQIDQYTDTHPPPQSKEIEAKFNGILSSFDTINNSNERRKNPSLSLSSCIYNIKALTNTILSHILELFSHSRYPSFQTELFISYKTDIKSYMQVVSEAFSNEFIQSGVPLCDLGRIKSNMFTDCKEIIKSLRSAFAFPDEMKEIQNLKNSINEKLEKIFTILAIPFALVIPFRSEEDLKKSSHTLNESLAIETDLEKKLKIVELKNEVTQKSISEFYQRIIEISPTKYSFDIDPLIGFSTIIKMIQDQNLQISEKDQKISMLTKRMQIDKENYTEKSIVIQEKENSITTIKNKYSEKLDKVIEENKTIKGEMISMQSQLTELESINQQIYLMGDPFIFRKRILEIIQNIEPDESVTNANDDMIIAKISSIMEKYMAKTVLLDQHEHQINTLDSFVTSLCKNLGFTESFEKLETLAQKIISEFNQKNTEIINKQNSLNEYQMAVSNELSFITNEPSKDVFITIRSIGERIIDLEKNSVESKNQIQVLEKKNTDNLQKIHDRLRQTEKITNNNEITVDTIISIISKMKTMIKDQKSEINQLNDLNNKLNNRVSYILNKLTKVLSIETTDNVDFLLKKTFSHIRKIEEPLLSRISDLESELSKQFTDSKLIYNRMCAVLKEKYQSDISSFSTLFIEMNSLVSRIQDKQNIHDSDLKSHQESESKLRDALYSIRAIIGKAIKPNTDNNGFLSDDKIIESTIYMCEEITSPYISRNYLSIHEIEKICSQTLKDMNIRSSHPTDYLPLLCKSLRDLNSAIFGVSSLTHHIDGVFHSLSTTKVDSISVDLALSIKSSIHAFKRDLDELSLGVSIHGVVSLLHKFIVITNLFFI